jgi:CheY-like chemotaxis protein
MKLTANNGEYMSHKILVVDDSRTIRSQLTRILRDAGYDVLTAATGMEALSLVRETQIRMLILDVQMPGMDGYAVCQELKAMGQPYSELPILFLTSLESRALGLLGKALGAYLRKPVIRENVLDMVARLSEPVCQMSHSA